MNVLADREFDAAHDLRWHPDDREALLQLARVTLDCDPLDESVPNVVGAALSRREDVRGGLRFFQFFLFSRTVLTRESGAEASRCARRS